MGTVVMNSTTTFQTGGGAGWSFASIGYFDLTTAFQQIATGIDPAGGSYSSNEARIDARTTDGPTGGNGDTGRNLEFRIRYFDNHVNAFFDTVDGTITSDIDYQIATSPLTIQTPIFATSVSLTAGT